MSAPSLDQALDRIERALLRIERSAGAQSRELERESQLRTQVASVVAELDQIIHAAGERR